MIAMKRPIALTCPGASSAHAADRLLGMANTAQVSNVLLANGVKFKNTTQN